MPMLGVSVWHALEQSVFQTSQHLRNAKARFIFGVIAGMKGAANGAAFSTSNLTALQTSTS